MISKNIFDRHFVRGLFTLAALVGCTNFSALAQARATPSATLGQGTRVDVQHLSLDLRFDERERRAHGVATLRLVPTEPTRGIALDAAQLAIESVTGADGKKLDFHNNGSDPEGGLLIRFDRPYGRHEELTIVIRYSTRWVNEADPNNIWGSEGKGLRFFRPSSTEPVKRRQIWSHGFPTANRYLFPGHDDPADLRTTEIKLTVPSPLMGIANGTLMETQVHDDGTRTFHWRMNQPHANHQTAIVVGEYKTIESEWEGIPLHSYGYPDELEAVAATTVRLPDMLRFFSQMTGLRYPFASYKQVFVQDYPWGAGNASGSTLTENMIDDARIHEDYRWLWDGLEAEGVAHQWFGVTTSARDLRHVWLTRGFAHYFDGLYNENKNGRREFLLWHRAGDLATHLADWSAGVREPIVPSDLAKATEAANGNGPYVRGALVLHALRTQLGDEIFWAAIRRYVATQAGRAVTTEDFRKSVEEAAGEPMGWFFEQWLEKVGHPIFQVSKSYDAVNKTLEISVVQTQTPEPKSPVPYAKFFRGKVDLKIDDRIERVALEPKAENIFTFSVASEPRLVHFDVEGAWIKELLFEKSLDELLYQLKHDQDVVAQVWAITELVKIGKQDATSIADKERVFAGLRAAILSDSFWRVRLAATNQLQSLLAPASETEAVALDPATREVLVAAINQQKAWNRSAAIGFLGMTRDPQYVDLYLEAMREPSHPVVYAAAIALGKTKSPRAFEALTRLTTIPSWKGESLLCALAGFKELRDPRAFAVALNAVEDQTRSRWTLATSRWDYRLAGAETLVALGRGAEAVPLVLARFEKSLLEGDLNDIFANAQLLATLADPRGQAVFVRLKEKFHGDANAMNAVITLEQQFENARAKLGS